MRCDLEICRAQELEFGAISPSYALRYFAMLLQQLNVSISCRLLGIDGAEYLFFCIEL